MDFLKNGNTKIGAGVWHFSTAPGNGEYGGKSHVCNGTCPFTCRDENGKVICYGYKGNYARFSSVRDGLAKTTKLLTWDMPLVFREIRRQIERDHIKTLRLHATGDFYLNGNSDDAVAYVKMWTDVFRDYPELTGWTYTKCYGISAELDAALDELDSLPNFNIVPSVVPASKGKRFNFGKVEVVLDMYKHLVGMGKNVYICRCGIDRNQHCNVCSGCSDKGIDYVLFVEHSTGYDPTKSPAYPELVEVINNQPMGIARKGA